MADFFAQAEALQREYVSRLPPVEKWNPPFSGDIDIRIARDGRWFHEGGEIKRDGLVKLFSSILKREGDDFFLVTPVEKWRLSVEDAPFVVVDFSRQGAGADQAFIFKTRTDDIVVADAEHPLWVESRGTVGEGDKAEETVPYIMVRNNLPGRISRNVYYHLIDLALEDEPIAAEKVAIRSRGQIFHLA